MTVSMDDPDLAAKIQARVPEALGAVVEAYLPQIVRAARGAGIDPSRAEDVAQSTFITFLQKADTFEGRSHVRTWLFGILYRKIHEARRGVQSDLRHDPIDDLMERRFDRTDAWTRPPRAADAAVQSAEVRGQIEDCLQPLPVRQRMAFTLREVEGLSSPEICKILEVTRTNLGVLLYRGRNRLRECLEAKGINGSRDANL